MQVLPHTSRFSVSVRVSTYFPPLGSNDSTNSVIWARKFPINYFLGKFFLSLWLVFSALAKQNKTQAFPLFVANTGPFIPVFTSANAMHKQGHTLFWIPYWYWIILPAANPDLFSDIPEATICATCSAGCSRTLDPIVTSVRKHYILLVPQSSETQGQVTQAAFLALAWVLVLTGAL